MTVVDPALLAAVRDRLAATDGPADAAAIGAVVRDSGVVLDRPRLAVLTRALQGELTGLGPLDALLTDPAVTDVLVNGPREVWVDRGQGLLPAAIAFQDEAAVRQLAVRLAARAGRRLDDAMPFVDARLPGGQRLHAVVPPLAVRGTAISLRIPSRRRFTLGDLVRARAVDEAGARWLSALVAARAAFLISGGTGSGKTSVLGALLGLVPARERMVIVEDTCELDPVHPHVVSLEARPANLEGQGEIPMRTLVRQALRMRPDRLVVGEVRGAEVVDMLAALNTGHEGGCGTVHANSATAVPARLAGLALAAGMPMSGVHAQVHAGIDAVVHLARVSGGLRVVAEIGVVSSSGGEAVVVPALVRDGVQLRPGPGIQVLGDRLGVSP
ncbi:MAG: TadA family conjugal transfer-associated ATPase [Candidatus Nanopelagicales bacterium]